MSLRRGYQTPFGGPASGLWPSGGRSTPPPPTPIPLPCLIADVLADCLAACAGSISQGTPGPVCGWTYFTSIFGPPGTIVFSPGSMLFAAPTSNEAPAASKGIVLASVNDLTMRFTFQEFSEAQGSVQYTLVVTDAGNADGLAIFLGANNDVTVLLGPQGNISTYLGMWAPNRGSHTVHMTVSPSGIPRLWIDGTEVSMALNSTGTVMSGFPASSVVVNFFDLNSDGIPRTAKLTSLFIASGQFPSTRTFCCP